MRRIFTKPEFRFAWGVSLTCAVLAMLAGYLWNEAVLDKTLPIGKMAGEVESITKRDDGSRLMIIKWTGIRQRHCIGSSERWLVNGYIHPLPPLPFPPHLEEKIGQDIAYKLAVEIPKEFPAHKGTYRAVSTYQCNKIQGMFPILSLTVPLPPIPFDLSGEKP